jgi:tripartite-type tricarboxylate transporter receptor subunit TctC
MRVCGVNNVHASQYGIALALIAMHAHGADVVYPVKPVRVIVPFAPGGGTDLIARALAQKLAEAWGQQVVVDNRAGGGTLIGSDMVAKAAPDGHTLLLTANPHTTNPALHTKLPYDTVRDFAGITQIAAAPLVLTLHPSMPARNVRELIALAKQRPGQLSYGTSGNGGPQHLAGEMFKFMAGVAMIHVPYRGGAPAIADLMAGQTQLMFGSTFTVIPQHAAGRLRALAVTSAQRSPALPNLPSIAEAALPGYAMTTWYGLFTPAATPRPLIAKLHADVARALKLPDVVERLARDGSDVVASEPAAFDAHVRSEIENARRIVKASGMRLD